MCACVCVARGGGGGGGGGSSEPSEPPLDPPLDGGTATHYLLFIQKQLEANIPPEIRFPD